MSQRANFTIDFEDFALHHPPPIIIVVGGDSAVQPIIVYYLQAITELASAQLMLSHFFFFKALTVRIAFLQSLRKPGKHALVKLNGLERFAKLAINSFFTNVVVWTRAAIPRAMIISIFVLFTFSGHRTTTVATR